MTKKAKALLLLSGGLDSSLVAAILKRENVDVTAIKFVTGLEYSVIKSELLETKNDDPAKKITDQLGIPLRYVSLKDVYIEMFLNPKYGYGSAINPCLDCHILMFKTAKKIMEEEGFDFIATGEVQGQRPMSQKSQDLLNGLKESGLEGRLLRPLSAKLLPITIPEKEGLINRDNLYDISGRSRQKQLELAKELGIEEYPEPAGAGCSIVDKGYARRYNELVSHNGKDIINMEVLQHLAIGRHIRLHDNIKLIVGRHKEENIGLSKRNTFEKNWVLLEPNYDKGPTAFLEIYNDVENLESLISRASNIIGYFSKEEGDKLSITATYKDGKKEVIEINNEESKNIEFEQIV